MRWLTAILIFLCFSTFAQNPTLRRICPDLNNNTLYWNNPNYPCANFHFYIIWASFDSSNFYPVDTNFTDGSELHIHLNANSSPGIPNKFYYIERRDSCGPDYNHYSQTLKIDLENPPSTFLDSVSVDVLTNKVVLGWSKNQLPDFNRYLTYKDRPYVSLDPAGLRDTFQTDNTGSDPGTRSFEYDINTIDSCGNPSIFGINPHSTIFLKYEIDTCKKTCALSWSHYKGWNRIRVYYIFQDSGTGYFLQDSVTGTQNVFTSAIILGLNYRFYVRAQKDTSIIITSSSNAIQFTTRKRIDPAFLNIDYVTSDPVSEKVILNFATDTDGETKEFIVNAFLNNVPFQTFSYLKSDIGLDLNTNLDWNTKYLFKVSAIDVCEQITLQSDSSTNIVLDSIPNNSRVLKWNSYFTWNTGIEKYIIYRGTGEGAFYTFTYWKETTTNDSITDTDPYEDILSKGVCYYVKALKAGSPGISSSSNILCFPNPFLVFIPNAFVPDGVNSLFRPGGSSIDYKTSRMEIYDRWGKRVFADSINEGWNGKDEKGEPCTGGVYYYRAEMISIKNEKLTRNGSFTLLR